MRLQEPLQALNQPAATTVNAAYRGHSQFGPGLLETVYHTCLAYELTKEGISIAQQMIFPIHYDGLQLDAGFRINLWLEGGVIAELKAEEALLPLHHAQLLTYLKLPENRLGLLINFNVLWIRDGIKRVVL